MTEDSKTPLLDQLEEGPWPSFVTEMKRAGEKNEMAKDLLHQLEKSYKNKIGYWKHGGIVGVRGYGGGVIGRYTELPEEFPAIAEFHTFRVNHPSGWFYTTDKLRQLCDVWDKHGSGLTNMHGATGDIILLGAPTDALQPCFDDLAEIDFDLGGSGSDMRTPSCCVGPGRCEFACVDTLDLLHDITNEFQDELHRPMFPYKSKIKISGCANDCVASVARSDFSVIGTWRDEIRMDPDEVANYADGNMDIQAEVVDLCPTGCIKWEAETKTLTIDNGECNRCMHCINLMPKALRPGKDQGATILVGGKAPIVHGALMAWVIVPFMKMEPPYDDFKDFIRTAWEWWDENGKMRERIGELINRLGMRAFLKAMDLPPVPQMISAPRANPYYFWDPEEVK
ncbi:MAG: dissimilatory-type sulfite reductase subunit alpha [Anaerolineales bacterium]|uniref:Dissimilatory-type sulfite reductase subunit alpha n=1 Tax=Candidatus Desulfolinea nitratireducens TaxID=2841698 RepID=A0A8J6NJ93_9CHLR|nr:dissimilatory-type sulfite reductase subunit alpha [Candidatus Desulfolinea nitratireducens]MBL6959685.1 dissimilatory-type sulfite reductase subunit alpha [Anaerolineales bacterium]